MNMNRVMKVLVLLIVVPSVFAQASIPSTGWNFSTDLATMAGRALSNEELEIAEYVLAFFVIKYYGNIPYVTLETTLVEMDCVAYDNAISVAVSVATNPAALGLLKLGRAGESVLKALIVNAIDTTLAIKKYIEKKAAEYDNEAEGGVLTP